MSRKDGFSEWFDDLFGAFGDFMSPSTDSFFGLPDKKSANFLAARRPYGSMKTDIVEKDNGYEMHVELPGYKKEEINVELKDDALIITASTSSDKEEKDGNKFIRRERFSGSQMRTIRVPEGIKQEDIKAKFEDGILKIEMPKPQEAKEEEKKLINID